MSSLVSDGFYDAGSNKGNYMILTAECIMIMILEFTWSSMGKLSSCCKFPRGAQRVNEMGGNLKVQESVSRLNIYSFLANSFSAQQRNVLWMSCLEQQWP